MTPSSGQHEEWALRRDTGHGSMSCGGTRWGRGSVSLALMRRPPGAVSPRDTHRQRWPRSALCPGHRLPAPFGKQRVCRGPPTPADAPVLASAALHAADGAHAAARSSQAGFSRDRALTSVRLTLCQHVHGAACPHCLLPASHPERTCRQDLRPSLHCSADLTLRNRPLSPTTPRPGDELPGERAGPARAP